MVICVFFVCVGEQLARRVCTECVEGWKKSFLPKTLPGRSRSSDLFTEGISMIFMPACASGLRQDVRILPSWPKFTLWRNQGLLVQNYLAFAFKTRGKPRLWRTNDPFMFQRDRSRDNTWNKFTSRAFERHCWAIPLDHFKEHCLTVTLPALQSGLQGSFIATKRETTTSSHELNQRKTIEDGTRSAGDTHYYVFARNLF